MNGGGRLRRATAVLLGLIAVVALLVACSGSAGTPTSQRNSTGDEQQFGPAVPEEPAPPATPASGSSGNAAVPGQFIIRSGTLELEVADVDASAVAARDLVQAAGGYVSASDEVTKDDVHYATITYRVPVDRWQEIVTALRGLAAKVVRENTKAEEVTSKVIDLNARIENLRASEASIREIMGRAGTINDVLAVQERLQGVQEQIERLVAQQQDLTGRASLATLAVTWQNPTPIIPAVTTAQSGWNLGAEIDRALAQTVHAGQVVASFLVWLVFVGVPVVGPIILVIALLAWAVRRYNRKHPRPAYVGWGPPPGAAPPTG
jgi:hypothetical protein